MLHVYALPLNVMCTVKCMHLPLPFLIFFSFFFISFFRSLILHFLHVVDETKHVFITLFVAIATFVHSYFIYAQTSDRLENISYTSFHFISFHSFFLLFLFVSFFSAAKHTHSVAYFLFQFVWIRTKKNRETEKYEHVQNDSHLMFSFLVVSIRRVFLLSFLIFVCSIGATHALMWDNDSQLFVFDLFNLFDLIAIFEFVPSFWLAIKREEMQQQQLEDRKMNKRTHYYFDLFDCIRTFSCLQNDSRLSDWMHFYIYIFSLLNSALLLAHSNFIYFVCVIF